ncbi:hypothetical protein RHMOL_Rhmol06G0171500 [Rhododendron molle]|uniref:Uncharacterized protein n=1 Tax=Rhododendron molle TaxID=49168 RepID=A0ACC0NEN2_RHOML|nr:hypothetical protein RHMOL_Rhmol06G0171500 [Rhododendron molle]
MAPRAKPSSKTAKGKAPLDAAPSQNSESGDEGNVQPEEVEELMVDARPSRRRKRTTEEVLTAAQKKWEDGMAKRNVKNERHVDAASFGAQHRAIRRITEQGLHYYFGECPGYNKNLVVDFYKKIVVPGADAIGQDDAQITSTIGRLEVVIDRKIIAKALDYNRPAAHEINYPRANFATFDEIRQDMYEGEVVIADTHVPGRFREGYKLINQFVHHNLSPRGAENKPSFEDGVLLYAFMQKGMKTDSASYIFKQIVEFKASAPTNSRMPFPYLITKICKEQGATASKYMEKSRLEPGIINITVLTKSMSQTRVPRATPAGDYLTTVLPRDAPKQAWYKKLFYQGVAMIASRRKEKKERRVMARKQDHMEHRLEWLISRAEGSSAEPYVPPPVEQAEDSDDFARDEPVSGDEA